LIDINNTFLNYFSCQ